MLVRIVGGFALLGLGLALTAHLLLTHPVDDLAEADAAVTGAGVAVASVTAGAAITGGGPAFPGGSPQRRLYPATGLGVVLTVLVTAVVSANAQISGMFWRKVRTRRRGGPGPVRRSAAPSAPSSARRRTTNRCRGVDIRDS